jgi:hypothetical protein
MMPIQSRIEINRGYGWIRHVREQRDVALEFPAGFEGTWLGLTGKTDWEY